MVVDLFLLQLPAKKIAQHHKHICKDKHVSLAIC